MWKNLVSAITLAIVAAFSVNAMAAKVNINSADVQTLADGIDGVGPAIAAAIVTYRDQQGPFKTIDQLVEVKGIGPGILEKNRDDLMIEGSSE